MVRVAAIGDVHLGPDSREQYAHHFDGLADCADLLLLAGDLTKGGRPEEARAAAEELGHARIPTYAVLGNHDHHSDAEKEVRTVLERSGIHVLEGEADVIEVGDCRVGIAGVKGFCGGFAGACGSDFGEREMKDFIVHTKQVAARLEAALTDLRADVRIALMHYAPIRGTLEGERLEIFPFLGSYLLAEAVDHAGADLIVHGHAHAGCERGITPGGIHVRNVAQPVLGHPYALYQLHRDDSGTAVR